MTIFSSKAISAFGFINSIYAVKSFHPRDDQEYNIDGVLITTRESGIFSYAQYNIEGAYGVAAIDDLDSSLCHYQIFRGGCQFQGHAEKWKDNLKSWKNSSSQEYFFGGIWKQCPEFPTTIAQSFLNRVMFFMNKTEDLEVAERLKILVTMIQGLTIEQMQYLHALLTSRDGVIHQPVVNTAQNTDRSTKPVSNIPVARPVGSMSQRFQRGIPVAHPLPDDTSPVAHQVNSWSIPEAQTVF